MIRQAEESALKRVAEAMVLAAITAPKGRGANHLETAILEKADLEALAQAMERIGAANQAQAFTRDAKTLREHASLAVLLGTRIEPLGLKVCGLCGFPNCDANRRAKGICAFNTGDLGIALGSAAAVAGAWHADNRIMYTIGLAAVSLQLLGPEVRIAYGIPLAARAKNPFFDRG